jgi:hypothetical protein
VTTTNYNCQDRDEDNKSKAEEKEKERREKKVEREGEEEEEERENGSTRDCCSRLQHTRMRIFMVVVVTVSFSTIGSIESTRNAECKQKVELTPSISITNTIETDIFIHR